MIFWNFISCRVIFVTNGHFLISFFWATHSSFRAKILHLFYGHITSVFKTKIKEICSFPLLLLELFFLSVWLTDSWVGMHNNQKKNKKDLSKADFDYFYVFYNGCQYSITDLYMDTIIFGWKKFLANVLVFSSNFVIFCNKGFTPAQNREKWTLKKDFLDSHTSIYVYSRENNNLCYFSIWNFDLDVNFLMEFMKCKCQMQPISNG